MARTNTWRLAHATFAVVLVLTLAPGGTSRASDATPDHEAHHAGTPAPDDVCDVAATPAAGQGSDGMQGMGTATPGMGMPDETPDAGMGRMGEFDLMFIDLMIPHHETAVAMAQVGLARARHDVALPPIHEEIVTLAEDIVATQGAEVAQMRAWRQAWYPDAPQMPMDQRMAQMGEMMGQMPGMEGMAMDPAGEIAALCAAQGPFDMALIDAMIPHHRSAVAMAEVAVQRATHPEVAQLAQTVVDIQQRAIVQMQEWRAAWYGGTPAGSPVARKVDVTLTEFGVASSLTEFRVGQPYRFAVTNAGALPHEFMIVDGVDGIGQMDMDALDSIALAMIPVDDLAPGVTRTVEVTFTEPVAAGALELVCAVDGHYDAGMTLPIVVSA